MLESLPLSHLFGAATTLAAKKKKSAALDDLRLKPPPQRMAVFILQRMHLRLFKTSPHYAYHRAQIARTTLFKLYLIAFIS